MTSRIVSITRGKFYYGWVVVAVGFAIQFLLTGFCAYGLSAFLKPMSDDLGWSRVTISGVQSFGNLIGGLVAPFIGPIIDKRGGRGLMILGGLMVGAGFVATGLVRSPLEFYFTRGIIVAVGLSLAATLTVSVVISNWFIRQRGKATSVAIMGTSLASAALTPLAAYLIVAYGWRTAWVLFGVAILVVIIPLVALFMKRRPEDIGLLPDGEAPAGGRESGDRGRGTEELPLSPDPRPLAPEEAWTRSEAMRTPAFWLSIASFGLVLMAASAQAMHFFPFLSDIHLSVTTAAAAVSVQGLTAFSFKPVWGILIDKYHVRTCGIVAFTTGSVAMASYVAMSIWSSPWLVFPGAFVMGIGVAGLLPVQDVFLANYFGRLSLGAIRSVASPIVIIFGASGPILAGWIYDRFGSYQFAFAFFAFAFATAGILVYFARQPGKAPKASVPGLLD